MNSNVLPEFQKFLLERNLINKKYIPFYAHWTSKFLAFSNSNESLTPDLRVREFLNQLRSQKNISDWQIKQADDAIRLYIHHFMDGNKTILNPNLCETKRKPSDISQILHEMREAIRIKHYSYRTEQSYLDWAKRFMSYIANVKKKDILTTGFDSNDVRDYLSYLALKRRVSSSTQNQTLLKAVSYQRSAFS